MMTSTHLEPDDVHGHSVYRIPPTTQLLPLLLTARISERPTGCIPTVCSFCPSYGEALKSHHKHNKYQSCIGKLQALLRLVSKRRLDLYFTYAKVAVCWFVARAACVKACESTDHLVDRDRELEQGISEDTPTPREICVMEACQCLKTSLKGKVVRDALENAAGQAHRPVLVMVTQPRLEPVQTEAHALSEHPSTGHEIISDPGGATRPWKRYLETIGRGSSHFSYMREFSIIKSCSVPNAGWRLRLVITLPQKICTHHTHNGEC